MISGGFGFAIDLQTGVARKWYMKNGITRWVDTGEIAADTRPKGCGEGGVQATQNEDDQEHSGRANPD